MSKFAALEQVAKELIEQGSSYQDLCQQFVDLPRHKLRSWFRKYSPELPALEDNLKVLETGESDISWVKNAAKQIFTSEFDNAIRLRALETVLKAVALETKASQDTAEEESTEDLRSMTDEELNQTFRSLL